MKKTSVHVKACNTGASEAHNRRSKRLFYVRHELTRLNESYSYTDRSLQAELSLIKREVKAKTGRKLQKNAEPIKEAVVVIGEETTMDDLKRFALECHRHFGMIPLQIHIHRDEGHEAAARNGEWKPNLHAHIVWRMYDRKGKRIHLSRADCSKMQDIAALTLSMERGEASDRKHVDALAYKVKAKTAELDEIGEQVAAGANNLVAMASRAAAKRSDADFWEKVASMKERKAIEEDAKISQLKSVVGELEQKVELHKAEEEKARQNAVYLRSEAKTAEEDRDRAIDEANAAKTQKNGLDEVIQQSLHRIEVLKRLAEEADQRYYETQKALQLTTKEKERIAQLEQQADAANKRAEALAANAKAADSLRSCFWDFAGRYSPATKTALFAINDHMTDGEDDFTLDQAEDINAALGPKGTNLFERLFLGQLLIRLAKAMFLGFAMPIWEKTARLVENVARSMGDLSRWESRERGRGW